MKKIHLFLVFIFIFHFLFTLFIIYFAFFNKLTKINFSDFGTIPLCNKNLSRGFSINGFVFPFCYRCTFMILFTILSLIFFSLKRVRLIFDKFKLWQILIFSFVFLFPLAIDGIKVYFLKIDSLNIVRIITGSLFGIGIGFFGNYMIQKLFFTK